MTIVLHHLETSRSTRILWLLEELGVDYEMKRYERDPVTRRSPPELGAVHPLAKAPTVEVDGRVMVESGAIIEYLIEQHGGGKLAPKDDADRAAYLEWLHFAEGTMAMPIILKLLGPAFGGLPDLLGGFVEGEVVKLLDYTEEHLADREWLVGADITGADINVEYLIELSEAVGLLENRPRLQAYLERLQARPAYRKAIELGGPIVLNMSQ